MTEDEVEKIKAKARKEGYREAESRERKITALEVCLRFGVGFVIGVACSIECGASVGVALVIGLVVGCMFAAGVGTVLLLILGGC